VTHGFDTSFLVAAEVAEHPEHAAVWQRITQLRAQGARFGLTTPVLAEFVHIVTDARRFTQPLTMAEALIKARVWWEAAEVEHVTANDEAVRWFLEAMAKHQLGRKRILDTMLAATYRGAGITSLLTLNGADFAVFGEFSSLGAI
jgi:predicted nucleic acid-binding protein